MGRESHHGSISHPVVLATWPLTLPADHCGGHEAAFEMPRIGQEPVPGGLFGSAGVPSSGSSFKAYVPVEPEAAQEPQEAQDGPDDAADGGSPQDAARKPRKARKRPDAS
jgi:hypothetical protein